MGTTESHEREIRAARNQSLFRALNEKIKEVNLEFSGATDMFVVACECADATCVETLDIPADDYAAVRAHPRRFVVLEGHIYPYVETVVARNDKYVVVEKFEHAGAMAEELSAAGSFGGNSARRPASG
jgi:5-bromo-4-chloroindolyl phosphate hydrolysis protein